jgi:hypothetical protein
MLPLKHLHGPEHAVSRFGATARRRDMYECMRGNWNVLGFESKRNLQPRHELLVCAGGDRYARFTRLWVGRGLELELVGLHGGPSRCLGIHQLGLVHGRSPGTNDGDWAHRTRNVRAYVDPDWLHGSEPAARTRLGWLE